MTVTKMRFSALDFIAVILIAKLTLCSSNYTQYGLSHVNEQFLGEKDEAKSDCICLKWTDWIHLGSPYVDDVPQTYATLLSYGKAKAATESAEICAVPVSSECRVLVRHDEEDKRQSEGSHIPCPFVQDHTAAPSLGEMQIKFLCWDHECPCLQWSKWFNYDGPNDDGDEEILGETISKEDWPCPEGSRPLDVDCRTASDLQISETKNKMLQCNLDGFRCLNRHQPKHCTCSDYKVRFLCLAPATKSSPTTEDAKATPQEECQPRGSKKCDFTPITSLVLDMSNKPMPEQSTLPRKIQAYGLCLVPKTCRITDLHMIARAQASRTKQHPTRNVKTGRAFGQRGTSLVNRYVGGRSNRRIDYGYPERRNRYDDGYPDRRRRYDGRLYSRNRHGTYYPARINRFGDDNHENHRYHYKARRQDQPSHFDDRRYQSVGHQNQKKLDHVGQGTIKEKNIRGVLDISLRPPVPRDYNYMDIPIIQTIHSYGGDQSTNKNKDVIPYENENGKNVKTGEKDADTIGDEILHYGGQDGNGADQTDDGSDEVVRYEGQDGGDVQETSNENEEIKNDGLIHYKDEDKETVENTEKSVEETIQSESRVSKKHNEIIHIKGQDSENDENRSDSLTENTEDKAEIIQTKGRAVVETDDDDHGSATSKDGDEKINYEGQDGGNVDNAEDDIIRYKGQDGGNDGREDEIIFYTGQDGGSVDDGIEDDGTVHYKGQDGGNDGREDEIIFYTGQDGGSVDDGIEDDGTVHYKGQDGGNDGREDEIIFYTGQDGGSVDDGIEDDGTVHYKGQDGGTEDGTVLRKGREGGSVHKTKDGAIRYGGQDGGNDNDGTANGAIRYKGQDGGSVDGIEDGAIHYKGQDGGDDEDGRESNNEDAYHSNHLGQEAKIDSQRDQLNSAMNNVRPVGKNFDPLGRQDKEQPEHTNDYYYSEDEPKFEELVDSQTEYANTNSPEQHSGTLKDKDHHQVTEINPDALLYTAAHKYVDYDFTDPPDDFVFHRRNIYDSRVTEKYEETMTVLPIDKTVTENNQKQTTAPPLPNHDHFLVVADLDYGYQSKEILDAKAKKKEEEKLSTTALPNHDHFSIVADLDYGYQSKEILDAKAKKKEEEKLLTTALPNLQKTRIYGIGVDGQHVKRRSRINPSKRSYDQHRPVVSTKTGLQSPKEYESWPMKYNNSQNHQSQEYDFPTGYGPHLEGVYPRQLSRELRSPRKTENGKPKKDRAQAINVRGIKTGSILSGRNARPIKARNKRMSDQYSWLPRYSENHAEQNNDNRFYYNPEPPFLPEDREAKKSLKSPQISYNIRDGDNYRRSSFESRRYADGNSKQIEHSSSLEYTRRTPTRNSNFWNYSYDQSAHTIKKRVKRF